MSDKSQFSWVEQPPIEPPRHVLRIGLIVATVHEYKPGEFSAWIELDDTQTGWFSTYFRLRHAPFKSLDDAMRFAESKLPFVLEKVVPTMRELAGTRVPTYSESC